ncbi:MAG TPA: YciI family protein [Chryseolinea sp.]|nr:YciI family protein [Chryseolinea sp.]
MRLLLLVLLLSSVTICFGQSKTYSFVFLHKKSSAEQLAKEQLDKIMEGHMANIERLAKEGKLLVAGPFDGGGGIFILNTTSTDEARQWLSTDPGIQANRWDIEILPYTPRIGAVCIAKEPYEMVTYNFIRFVEMSTAIENAERILKQHHEFVLALKKSGNLITEGIFEPRGSILILKGEMNDTQFESDPAVQHGIISIESKKLWIAKGSFCEQ